MAVVTAKLRALYGLSRGTQATLSVAQPLLGVLAVTDHPLMKRLLLITAAALTGYVAVFSANDLLDTRLDQKRFANERAFVGFDVDSIGARHPVARGMLAAPIAVAWVAGLVAVTAVLVARLGRVCLALFVAAVLLEVAYCLLAKVTPAKCALSGVMVAMGASVGALAMPGPVAPLPLILLAVWMTAWEIGGRNIVNDMADADEDVQLGIRTLPVVFGLRVSATVSFACMMVATTAALGLALVRWPSYGPVGVAGAALASVLTLVEPGLRLLRDPKASTAMEVFNRATFHPVLVLASFSFAPLAAVLT